MLTNGSGNQILSKSNKPLTDTSLMSCPMYHICLDFQASFETEKNRCNSGLDIISRVTLLDWQENAEPCPSLPKGNRYLLCSLLSGKEFLLVILSPSQNSVVFIFGVYRKDFRPLLDSRLAFLLGKYVAFNTCS